MWIISTLGDPVFFNPSLISIMGIFLVAHYNVDAGQKVAHYNVDAGQKTAQNLEDNCNSQATLKV